MPGYSLKYTGHLYPEHDIKIALESYYDSNVYFPKPGKPFRYYIHCSNKNLTCNLGISNLLVS
jgi:hypothetical protein